jgi:nucleoside-diphosphate-sugar epimerase
MAVVDGGRNPCNLVYVDNLIQAVLLALWKPDVVGETFFITDENPLSWEQCLDDHGKLIGMAVPRLAHEQLYRPSRSRLLRDSLRMAPPVLASAEARAVLRRIPLVSAAEYQAWRWFHLRSTRWQEAIRWRLSSPRMIRKNHSTDQRIAADDNIIAAQARTFAHSIDKAKQRLGYTAPFSYREGMGLTEAWLRYAHILP